MLEQGEARAPQRAVQGFFVTGTDTDVGKTVFTAALLRALRLRGLPACGLKPVQTGVYDAAQEGDAARYTDAVADLECGPVAFTLRSFSLAASPHLAAQEAGQSLLLEDVCADVQAFAAQEPRRFLLVEGAGGLLVPLNARHTMLDMMARLGLPVLLVVANRLGALNHALLSVEALHNRGLTVAALIITHTRPHPQPGEPGEPGEAGEAGEPGEAGEALQQKILQDTQPCLAARLPGIPVFSLPYTADLALLPPTPNAPHAQDAQVVPNAPHAQIAQGAPTAKDARASHGPDAPDAQGAPHGPDAPDAQGASHAPDAQGASHASHAQVAAKRARAWQHLAELLAPVAALAAWAPLSSPPPAAGDLPFSSGSPHSPAVAPAPSVPSGDFSPALCAFDAAHVWHPYTSATRPLPARLVERTGGNKIYLAGGQGLVDGMSSWWCAIHGYGQPRLVQALQAQAERMSHVMFGGLTHEPAVKLAQKLLPLLPLGLEHLFFADSGSVAVEVALKMALQYAQARHPARPRHHFLVPRGGYHGDTVGAMSVCDPVNGMHSLFKGFLPEQHFVPRPDCPFGAFNAALPRQPSLLAANGPLAADGPFAADVPFDPACLVPLEQAFARHGQETAALILEPIVQGAGGMWVYHPRYLQRAAALCREYEVLLITDEIATGFGRTGKMFACEWAGISPDILCLGKALTGGMMSLAATACSARVAQGIGAGQGGQGVFMHGPTFMGNPLACAVAAASVDLLLESPWQARIAAMEQHLAKALAPCAALPGVAGVRVLGGIGVVECSKPVPVEALQHYFVAQGVWLRPFGRLIYLMPPYTLRPEELEQLTSALCGAVQKGLHIL